MKSNNGMSLKCKLKNQQVTIGSWITIGNPSIAEIMANCGFDWLTIDMEHSAITLDIAQNLIQVIELAGCIPLVRVGVNDENIIKRVMDAGAHGVIVPQVNSVDDARRAVHAVKYPPYGFRGVGLGRAQGYGTEFENYRLWNEKESIVIVQIEHIDAVRNLEDILKVDGVDGYIVGPYDLSASLGVPGRFDDPSFLDAIEKINQSIAIIKHVSPGFHVVPPDVLMVQEKILDGFCFIGYSLDSLLIAESCMAALSEIKGNEYKKTTFIKEC